MSRLSRKFSPLLLTLAVALACALPCRGQNSSSDPWGKSQTVQPPELAKELSDASKPPLIIFVGFQRLFSAGHIHGAQFHGSAGSAEGLAQLKAWAATLPRTSSVVIYCGCCPMEKCPNIRPAFTAFHDLGFKNLRVLLLPNDFAADWADRGYSYDKGQ
jgi:thiosulfate/3-mercaptopyruvate sulfurtransferase